MVLTRVPFTIANSNLRRRRGATVVEVALIFPLVFLLVVGLAVGGLGVFRYQQVAFLAHLGARYASVRGGQYEAETGQTAASEQDVFNYIVSQSTALKSNALTVEVFLNVTTIDAGGNPTTSVVAWNASNKAPYSVVSDRGEVRHNMVSARVTYNWLPEAFLAGPITLSSTATMPMQY
jgi:Flp pilus assembly protein TadG